MTSILTIDTATDNCSVALSHRHQLFTRAHQGARQHTEKLLPMVDEVLKESRLNLAEVDAIAVTTGPGSFTGLRIGVSVAQGLAYSADLPVISLDTLEVLSNSFLFSEAHSGGIIIALLDARMGDVTWSSYRVMPEAKQLSVLRESSIGPIAELTDYINSLEGPIDCIGPGCDLLVNASLIDSVRLHSAVLPEASSMLELALANYKLQRHSDADQVSPDYFRTEINWQKRQFIRQPKA